MLSVLCLTYIIHTIGIHGTEHTESVTEIQGQIYVNENFIQSVHLKLASGLPRQRVIRQPATGSV